MYELDKILEEIKAMLEENKVIELNGDGSTNRCIIDVALAWDSIKSIIRKHMNDGWIQAEERRPKKRGICTLETYEVTAFRDRCYIVTTAVYDHDEKRWLTKSEIIAWRPLPEPYHPERIEA